MERLNPRIRLVWVASAVLGALGLGAAATGLAIEFDRSLAIGVGIAVAIAALGVGYAVLRYRAWQFEVQPDGLYIERGVLTRVTTVVPFVRVQHVDSRRGPVERLAGLSSVVVYTAGSRGADVSIPGLDRARATDLQAQLRELAIESEDRDAV